MDLNRAAVFAAVVDAGSFSAAGRRLASPKSTVSKQVADLEAELGVRLLNRTTRRLSLTEAGSRVYTHMVQALRHAAEAEREVQALQETPEGMLTVAAPAAIGVPFLMPAITLFMALYPKLKVTLLSVAEAGQDWGGIDVLIAVGNDLPAGHATRLVAEAEIGLFASVDYLARRGAIATPADLTGHDVIAFTQASDADHFAWRLARGETQLTIAPDAQPRFRSNDAVAVLAAVAAGGGIGGLPVRYVERAPEGRDLVPVLPGWRGPPTTVTALVRDGSASSLKTRLFLAFAKDWFARI